MKRGQIGNVFLNIIVIILVGIILFFGYTQISKFVSSAKEVELVNFNKKFSESLERNRASINHRAGSVDEEVFYLPDDVKSLCFVDETKGFDRLVSPELNELMDVYEGYTVYFDNPDIVPIKVDYLELSEGNNPLCAKVTNGQLKLKMTSRRGKTEVELAELGKKKVDCNIIEGTTDPDNKVDVVFLGYGYDDKEVFNLKVREYIDDVFFNFEPFNSNRDKFTFYFIDDFEDLDCSFNNWIVCDDFKIKKLASNCPNDYTIVLAARSWIADLFDPVRSSAIGNVEKVNTMDNPNVVVHEFGHIFGGLADEYVDDYYSQVDFRVGNYPNCDVARCEKWNDLSLECYGGGQRGSEDGCSLTEYYRSTETSIMRELDQHSFGPVSERAIIEKLNAYGGGR